MFLILNAVTIGILYSEETILQTRGSENQIKPLQNYTEKWSPCNSLLDVFHMQLAYKLTSTAFIRTLKWSYFCPYWCGMSNSERGHVHWAFRGDRKPLYLIKHVWMLKHARFKTGLIGAKYFHNTEKLNCLRSNMVNTNLNIHYNSNQELNTSHSPMQ